MYPQNLVDGIRGLPVGPVEEEGKAAQPRHVSGGPFRWTPVRHAPKAPLHKKSGASPNKKTKLAKWKQWNVDKGDYQKAVDSAAALGYPDDERIEFLCAKGVDVGPMPYGAAPSRFDLLVNPPDKHWKERQNSLHGILGLPMGHGEKREVKDYTTIPEDISFQSFVKKHPEWEPGKDVFVFFRDHFSVFGKNVLIQREQIFGTCAIHAPVTLQHYLVAKWNHAAVATLDIPSWMRHNANEYILEGILFGRGTQADVVLAEILLPLSLSVMKAYADIPESLELRKARAGGGHIEKRRENR